MTPLLKTGIVLIGFVVSLILIAYFSIGIIRLNQYLKDKEREAP